MPLRWARVVVVACSLLLAAGALYLYRARPWDPHLSPEETATRLVQMEHLTEPYDCDPEQGDESIGLKDVDYLCSPTDFQDGDFRFWVGTNDTRVTGIIAMGP